MSRTSTPRHSFSLAGAVLCLAVAGSGPRAAHATEFGSWPVARGWQQVTHASWYGREFAGRRTAMGRRFNPNELTAAHRSLELGTWVRVTDLSSGRSVVVQITDRGPFKRRRGIDLSYEAARQLGMVRRGVARVRIEIASAPDREREAGRRQRDARAGQAGRIEHARGGPRSQALTVAASTAAWLADQSLAVPGQGGGNGRGSRRPVGRS